MGAAAGAIGCSGEGSLSGPCVVQYAEPLITVVAASDAASGRALPRLILRSYTHDGRVDPAGLDFLTNHFGLSPVGVTIEGTSLACDLPCAFGATPGRYALTFGAAGFRDTTVVLDASYARGEGSCPRTLSGGVRVRVALPAR